MVVSANSAHLVDLTAHADDVWDRIRLGFSIPNMDAPVVVEQQAWFLSHPDFLQRGVERSSPYLFPHHAGTREAPHAHRASAATVR